MGVFNKIVFSFLVYPCVLVCVCIEIYPKRHQRAINFDPGGICGGLVLAPSFTSARLQSRFEFVELGVDKYVLYLPGRGFS